MKCSDCHLFNYQCTHSYRHWIWYLCTNLIVCPKRTPFFPTFFSTPFIPSFLVIKEWNKMLISWKWNIVGNSNCKSVTLLLLLIVMCVTLLLFMESLVLVISLTSLLDCRCIIIIIMWIRSCTVLLINSYHRATLRKKKVQKLSLEQDHFCTF